MRPAVIMLVAGLAMISASDRLRANEGTGRAAASVSAASAGALLYLDQTRWQQADRAQKITLAADFMRIFCGNPSMPASDLVGCLDNFEASGPIFERALSCVATNPGRGL
jgi:hypothetical protein